MAERIGDFAKLNFPEEWPPEKRADVRAQYQQAEGKAGRKKTEVKRPGRGMRKAKHTTKRPPQKARKEPKARSR